MDTLRHVNLDGYTLKTWSTARTDWRGQTKIGYEMRTPAGEVLFTGDDFAGSPLRADDSDDTLRELIGFLTLRPGDTDPDYFDGYTEDQLAFCDTDAEALSMWSMEDCGPFVEVEA